MPPNIRRYGALLVDVLLTNLALISAYLMRLPEQLWGAQEGVGWALLIASLACIASSIALNTNEISWRYISARDLPRLAGASAIVSIAVALFGYLTWTDFATPRSVPAILLPIHLMLTGAVRLGWRLAREEREESKRRRQLSASNTRSAVSDSRLPPSKILLVGPAGAIDKFLHAHGAKRGSPLAELLSSGRSRVLVEGFAADRSGWLRPGPVAIAGAVVAERRFVGTVIRGARVLGAIEQIDALLDEYGPSLDGVAFLEDALKPSHGFSTLGVIDRAKGRGLRVLQLRGRPEIANLPAPHASATDGAAEVFELAPLRIEDLLQRQPRQLNPEAAERALKGKTALVTGGGGSIGSELCRQLARLDVDKLVIVESNEYNLYRIEMEIKSSDGPSIRAAIGDVRDKRRLAEIFREEKPDVVFHAAALKHVPMVEMNRIEAVRTNIAGVKNVLDLSLEHDIEGFVLVSTDKAVHPMSFMGVTKRIAERLVQATSFETRDTNSRTRLLSVRFGNVLGSSGSVIPLFREQISHGGPVTVTHPDMERYFMTIPEAAALIIQGFAELEPSSSSGSTERSGASTFILDMGEPVRIMDLAESLIRLSGFVPHTDIRIAVTGLRPAEKLYEDLSYEDESLVETASDAVRAAISAMPPPPEYVSRLEELIAAAEIGDETTTVETALTLAPGHLYRHGAGVVRTTEAGEGPKKAHLHAELPVPSSPPSSPALDAGNDPLSKARFG